MKFNWYDYNPQAMGFIEKWIDAQTVRFTGLDEGFQKFYEYWASEDGFDVGTNFWCKVIFENKNPVAVITFCKYADKITVMEIVVRPDIRAKGIGSALLTDLIDNIRIVHSTIQTIEAVIFPDNIASQKAFEKAGFYHHHTHKDGDALYYVYEMNT